MSENIYSDQLEPQASNAYYDNDNSKEQVNDSSSKRYLTYIYCLVFWNFGLCVAIFGPTLLDLACQTSSSLSAMSVLFFMQNFTSLIGVFVSGILLKNNRITVINFLLVCTLLMSLCVAFMPISKNFLFLALVMILLGFNMGCVDNVANLAIMKLHSNNVSPYIQTMHFFYGIGAFVTPLIVKSFLNSNFDIKMTHSTFNCYNIEEIINKNKTIFSGTGTGTTIATVFKHHSNSFINNHMAQQVEEIPEVLTKQTEFTSNTKYAFWILAFIQLPAAAFLVFLKKKNLVQEPVIEKSKEPEEGLRLNVEHIKTRISTMPLKELTFLASAIVFLFEGLQASHGGYIFSYAVETYDLAPKHSTNHHKLMNKHPHSHNNNEAYITALFWAFFSIGRLASVFIATKISAPCMLFIDIIGCFVSTFLMCLSGLFGTINLLYFSTCLLGLFLSNTTPTIYSLVEIFIGSTPTLTSFVIICAASGEMMLPVIVASLFDLIGPGSLIVVELTLTIIAGLLFAKFVHYAKKNLNCFNSVSSFIWIHPIGSSSLNENSNLIGKSSVNQYSKMDEEDGF